MAPSTYVHFVCSLRSPLVLAYLFLSVLTSIDIGFLFGSETTSFSISFLFSVCSFVLYTAVLIEVTSKLGMGQISMRDGLYIQLKIWMDWILTLILLTAFVSLPLAFLALLLEMGLKVKVFGSHSNLYASMKPFVMVIGIFIFIIWKAAVTARGWRIRAPIGENSIKALAELIERVNQYKDLFIVLIFVSLLRLLKIYSTGSNHFMIYVTAAISGLFSSTFDLWAVFRMLEHEATTKVRKEQ